MVDGQGLTGVLDWEFADWGDPMSDIGWFCAACWRYAHPELEAGGIAPRDPFYRGSAAVPGQRIDPEVVAFWEIMAHLTGACASPPPGERQRSRLQASLARAHA